MRYKIKVNDYEYALTDDQIETLYRVLEQAQLLYQEDVGENSGYTGWKNRYVYNFDKTLQDADFGPKGMLSDNQLHTYKELWRLRKGEQHD